MAVSICWRGTMLMYNKYTLCGAIELLTSMIRKSFCGTKNTAGPALDLFDNLIGSGKYISGNYPITVVLLFYQPVTCVSAKLTPVIR